MSFIFTNGLQFCVCFFSSHFCCHCSLFNLHSSDCFICLLYVIHVNCVWEYVIDCVSADQLLFSQIRELCKHAILIRLNKHEYFKAHPVVVFHGTLGKITWIRQHTSFHASKENDYAVFFPKCIFLCHHCSNWLVIFPVSSQLTGHLFDLMTIHLLYSVNFFSSSFFLTTVQFRRTDSWA